MQALEAADEQLNSGHGPHLTSLTGPYVFPALGNEQPVHEHVATISGTLGSEPHTSIISQSPGADSETSRCTLALA